MNTKQNKLGTMPVTKLLIQFAIPSIVAMLVSALYNIVDQFFIGRSIGQLGNAATNIAFPLSTSCTAIALLLGIGGASCFNLTMGEGNKEKAVNYLGNAASLLFLFGTILAVCTQIFLRPMLLFFGAPENVLGYAMEYTRITSIGFPFLIFSVGGGHLVRADGTPQYAMMSNLTGAVINTILDALFIFGFGMGMQGAALATIIGQVISAVLIFRYLMHCKTVTLQWKHICPKVKYAEKIMSLGAAPCFNQLAMMIVQIVLNKSLTYYGRLSVYGDAVPLACAGIITKVNMLYFSVVIGLSQGSQPIASFNYGAKQFDRVRETYKKAVFTATVVSCIAFLLFQFVPREIIAVFGSGSEEYFQFATRYFKIFLFATFLNGIQPISSNFFTAMGKPKKGIFLSLTRQIIFLLPLILIFPLLIGIDGIMYAGPIADIVAAIVSLIMISFEFKKMKELEVK